MADRAIEQMLARQRSQYFGKYRGRVVDNYDPNKKGRLKVTIPQVLGEVAVWAMPCVPYAGPELGFYTMPEVDAGVWVEFEAGDPSFPVWVGCFWNDGDIPDADAKPSIKFFRTNKFRLRIDDDEGEILIENDSGSEIRLTSEDIVIKSAKIGNEASGGRKTLLSSGGFNVNDGALEVT